MGFFWAATKKSENKVENNEPIVVKTAEEARKISKINYEMIKNKEKDEKQKELAEFSKSDKLRNMLKWIDRQISEGYTSAFFDGISYDYYIVKAFFEPYGYKVSRCDGDIHITWIKFADDTDDKT